MIHRRLTLPLLALAAAVTFVPVASASPLMPQQAAEIRYTGGIWRGSIGDRIEVSFKEGGREQTVTGELLSVDRFAMTLNVSVDGRSGRKVIVLGDIRSVKLVEAGAAPSTDASATADDTTMDSDEGSASPEASASPRRGFDSQIEHPDTAGPIAGPRADGKKTVFILPLSGTVGVGLRHEEIDRIEKEADKLGPGQIIVLRINSPGGAVVEGDRIYESITRLKKKHRVVSWIEEAISGGAFTALIADEMYFMDVGSLGAITMFTPGGPSITGERLQAWLDKIYEVCEIGGRWGHICRCMVHSQYELSYDVDPDTGKVTWHDDLSGQYPLSIKGDNLSFNATDAVRSRFAQGRANTEYELLKALQLEEGKYVVSHAGKKIAADWAKTQEQARYEVPRLVRDIQNPPRGRDAAAALGSQIQAVKRIITWWDRAPNVMAMELQLPPKTYFQDLLKQLQKQLADMQRARRG